MEPLPRKPCLVCDQALDGETCGNRVCRWEYDVDRFFRWNQAIAMRSGQLERVINRYKYDDHKGWGVIFGRVIAGFLADRHEQFEHFDYMIPSPTFVGGKRSWDHTKNIVYQAWLADEDNGWPFYLEDPPLIEKARDTTSFVKAGSWSKRFEIATKEVRPALRIPDPSRTAGKLILVIDDVFTEGLNLNEVARCLRLSGGAELVCGLSLARQRWGA
jgi:predicted amidophosphoribosyltransferase